jgi:hypothetical protein
MLRDTTLPNEFCQKNEFSCPAREISMIALLIMKCKHNGVSKMHEKREKHISKNLKNLFLRNEYTFHEKIA